LLEELGILQKPGLEGGVCGPEEGELEGGAHWRPPAEAKRAAEEEEGRRGSRSL
jgi:hypothetical protein